MNWKNFKLRNKLLMSFALISLILLGTGWLAIRTLNEYNNMKAELNTGYELADAIMESKYFLTHDVLVLMELLTSEEVNELNGLWQDHKSDSEGLQQEIGVIKEIAGDKSWGENYRSEKNELVENARRIEADYKKHVLPSIDKIYNVRTQYLQLRDNSLRQDSVANQQLANFMVQLNENDEYADGYAEELVSLFDLMEEKLESNTITDIVERSDEMANAAIIQMTIFTIFGIVLALVLAFIISGLITKPIHKLQEFIIKIGKGDLTEVLENDARDEIGQMANELSKTVKILQKVLGNVRMGIANIASASGQLSNASQQMSQGATEQASAAEEVSSSMEQMVSNIQQNNDNAKQTAKKSTQAHEGIQQVATQANQSLEAIREIADKITIVNDIASKTNILALNAAVEAARAGEHGKGFAVVAAEVRKLAERSNDSAEEIEKLSIGSVKVTEQAGALMKEIIPEIESTSHLVQEISAASVEQNSGADQINNAVQQLNQVTQQNAAASEEIATNSEELSSQADQLRNAIAFFKVDENHSINIDKIHTSNGNGQSHTMEGLMSTISQKPSNGNGVTIDLGSTEMSDSEFERM